MAILKEELKSLALGVIKKEADAVMNLQPFVDENFINILNLIFNSKGRLIITGIGKSAIIEARLWQQ